MFAKIVVLSPPYKALTYKLPSFFPDNFWKIGQRVIIPLNTNKTQASRVGYIQNIFERSDLPEDIVCREIYWPLEINPILNNETTELALNLSHRHGNMPGLIYGNVLPSALRMPDISIRNLENDLLSINDLSDILSMSPKQKQDLAIAIVEGSAIIEHRCRNMFSELCELQIDPPWPIRPNAVKQIQILDYLYEKGSVSKQEIVKLFSSARSSLTSLINAGYVKLCRNRYNEIEKLESNKEQFKQFELTSEQQAAVDALTIALYAKTSECRLLYGITGSGKTAVYAEIIKLCLNAGQSSFLLAPEVAIACRLRSEIEKIFSGYPIYFYHGYLSSEYREKIFREIAEKQKPCIVIGARSALFLPAFNPGCIILDEEHDASYKQDEKFAYHAKEIAWFRTRRNNGLLILGSATPDIRSYYACQSGSIAMLRLKTRISGHSLPEARLVDIGAHVGMAAAGSIAAINNPQGLLAKESEEALLKCLSNNEQAVILLNRRGYAPMLYCPQCSNTLRCPNCGISLTFHKSLQKMVCHYCNYSIPYPSPCPECGRINFLPIGEGDERLEERLQALAGRPILRLDRDSVRRPARMEEILKSFARRESPFLVGTQMLSKGHHFPNVTLVIAADGDIGLNLPDYRAAERTFQLLIQAAGRSGRGQKPGEIIIQTRNKSHYCWEYILNNDYKNFYDDEIARRKKNNYPPFTNLALLRISHLQNEPAAAECMMTLASILKEKARELGARLLGPAPSPIAMISGRKRYQCLIKSKDWNIIRQIYFHTQKIEKIKCLRLFLDLDPTDML